MPATSPSREPAVRELHSWKEIGDYLGVTVRTAQAWEVDRGLPVKRTNGIKGRVFADSAEIDRWKQAHFHKKRWWERRFLVHSYAIVITALFLITLTVSWTIRARLGRKGPPAICRLESPSLVVTDANGNELWRKHFQQPFAAEEYAQHSASGELWFWVGNLDGDPGLETLFLYHPISRDKAGTALICFDQNGREKWRFLPGRIVSDETSTYSRNYTVASFMVADVAPAKFAEVLVSSHHISSYPNQFVVLSSAGSVLGEYWHSGHLTRLDVADFDGDGREEIMLGGFNSGYRQATLILLDPAKLAPAAARPDGDPHTMRGFGPAREKQRVMFPRTCLNAKFEEFNWVRNFTIREGFIHVGVSEWRDDPDYQVIYTLDKHLRVTDVRFSESLTRAHRRLESRGDIDHALSAEEIAKFRTLRF